MKTLLILFVISQVVFIARSTPSVQIVENADPYADARAMHKALKGPGTDEKAIRHILPYRSCNQRTAISQAYWELYRDDITRRIARDTSGTYEQIVKDCFLCGEFLMASFFERAITGNSDRHRKNKSVIEIIVTHTDSREKRDALLSAYQQMYSRTIEHDIRKHLGGDFENVLLEMIWRERASSNGCDYNKAHDMAMALNNEINKWGDHRNVLDTVLMNTAFDQANVILDEFKKITGFDLITVVSNKMNHEKANAYEDLIHYVATYENGHLHYYATRLKEATDGPGTDEQTLNRIILSHAEIDMKEIEDTYYIAFHKKLASKIAHDTSGAYEHFLKQFLTKSSDEAKAGMQLALWIVDQENKETKMLAEQGLLMGTPNHPMMLNPQSPVSMNRFPSMQVSQTPQNHQIPQYNLIQAH